MPPPNSGPSALLIMTALQRVTNVATVFVTKSDSLFNNWILKVNATKTHMFMSKVTRNYRMYSEAVTTLLSVFVPKWAFLAFHN